MRSLTLRIFPAGLISRPALLPLLGCLMFLSSPIAAQKGSVQTVDAFLGVRIGTDLNDARNALAKFGTGGGRDTRDGGRKEAWTLEGTDYSTLAFKTDGRGKVVWVSAFVRPTKEVQFSKLGEAKAAAVITDSEAIWNVKNPNTTYRLVAKGANGKAQVIYLLSLEVPEVK